MTDRLRAAAQAALEAMELIRDADTSGATPKQVVAARKTYEPTIEQLRAALAEPENGGGLYLTIVYKDVQPGPETSALTRHPKVSAVSWSHAIGDRNAARAALAEPTGKDHLTAAEPYLLYDDDTGDTWMPEAVAEGWALTDLRPLYNAPPRREWVSLTDEEVADIALNCYSANRAEFDDFKIARAIEQLLKERNHD